MEFINLDLYNTNGGVYMITNRINNKFYIGSTNNFHRRFVEHTQSLRNKKSQSIVLQRAIDKYGLDNFGFMILDICNDLSKDNLLNREQLYLDKLKPQYNTNPNATKVDSIRSKEAIEKQRISIKKYFEGLGNKSHGHMNPVLVTNESGETIYEFRSFQQAIKELSVSRQFLENRLNGIPCKIPKYRGYKFYQNEKNT